jgi:beta-glucanase (GH16 family)
MRWIVALMILLPVGVVAQTPPAQASGYTLVFDDEFTTLNINSLADPNGNYTWFNPGIWYKTPASPYANYSIINGTDVNLVWTRGQSPPETTISTCSPNGTSHCQTWQYGYFEASMRFDIVSGAWPAFWMLSKNNYTISPGTEYGEFDIMEYNYPDMPLSGAYEATVHDWNHPGGSIECNTGVVTSSLINASTYNTYGMLWTPGVLKFYFNNVLKATCSIDSVIDTSPQYFLMLGSQEGYDWSYGSLTNVTATSIATDVDWVHVFQLVPGPNLAFSPTSNNFGNEPVNSSTSKFNFTLSNTGSTSGTLSSISVGGANAADFAESDNCGAPTSFASGATCTVGIIFTPSAAGARTATLNATDTPDQISTNAALSGTGTSTAAEPACTPVGGSYTSAQSVTCTEGSAGAIICYTLGSSPATPATNGVAGCTTGTLYVPGTSPAIAIAITSTLKLIAGGTGYADGTVRTYSYTITSPVAPAPACTPGAGTYTSTQSVTCTDAAPVICYTTNGINPATNGSSGCTTGTLYSGAISVASTTTLKVIAGGTGYTDGTVSTYSYIIEGSAPPPVCNPGTGTYNQTISVTCMEPVPSAPVICYTTNSATPQTNGTTGCTTGTLYTTTLSISATTTLKLVGGGTGYTDSTISTYTYTRTAGSPDAPLNNWPGAF